jgi:hypothetical protein
MEVAAESSIGASQMPALSKIGKLARGWRPREEITTVGEK